MGGAEKLKTKGALLFKTPELSEPMYLQGAYMPKTDIERLVAYIASKSHDLSNKFDVIDFSDALIPMRPPLPKSDITSVNQNISDSREELAGIIHWLLQLKFVSVRQIKLQFPMGNRANYVMDELFRLGLVSDKYHNQPRKVLPKSYEELSEEVINLLNRLSCEDIDFENREDFFAE